MGQTCLVHRNETYYVCKFLPRLHLAKLPLCLMVAFSSAFGYTLALPVINIQLFSCAMAVLLLATGAASYNSLQEIRFDALMERTKNRPLITHKLTEKQALTQAISLAVCGIIVLAGSSQSVIAVGVGISALLIYNFVYTLLKKKTVLSIIPGALCGAFPPLIGWLSGGGAFFSFQALLVVILLILWQVPHFFLVLLNHKKDYLESVSPNMLQMLKENSLQRIFISWIGALAVIMITFTVIPNKLSDIGRVCICVNALLLFLVFVNNLFLRRSPNYHYLFFHLNFSLCFMMVVVCTEVIKYS